MPRRPSASSISHPSEDRALAATPGRSSQTASAAVRARLASVHPQRGESMRLTRIVPLLVLAAALPLPAAAQRYGATSGSRAGMDTTVAFASGDEIRVTSYPSMATGVQLCGTVAGGMHWGKMMMANAGGGTTTTVVTFPSASVTAQCQPYRYTSGDWLTLSFTRTVRDDYGRIARMPVGEIV